MSVNDFWTPFELYPFLNALFIGLSLASIWLVAAHSGAIQWIVPKRSLVM